MKKKAAISPETSIGTSRAGTSRVHPVVIYPFHQPADYSDLAELYRLVARLDAEPGRYARPLTVIDRKTCETLAGDPQFREFRQHTVARHSEVIEAWCVDTCQMWYTGLGHAFDQGGPEDVYWLIPGDFNYGTPSGREVLERLHDLPEIIEELQQDFCIGEVAFDHASSKHLIDTYGTFALLYNWFPVEALEIQKFTQRPRSEFLALRHGFLREMLCQRWFAYEQTVVMLLQSVINHKQTSRFDVGGLSDLPASGESAAAAILQVERTARVLKTLWLERNQTKAGWQEQYRTLKDQSEQICHVASTVLQNLLR